MKKQYKLFTILLAILFVTACDDYLDINHDPDASEEASLDLVFPAAMASTAYVVGTSYQILGGFWAQYWTQNNTANQYKNIDSYDLQNDAFDDREWGELYANALNDYKYVINRAEEEEEWNYYLMATVMMAYTFQVLSDVQEEIPFTEALQGFEGNLEPHFDNQQTVYDGLITMIDEALSKDLSSQTLTIPENDDLLFGGDMDNWVRFANTLKLKIFLRQSYVRPTVAQNGIAAMYTNGDEFLATNAAMTQFVDQQEKRNPLYDRRDFLSANNETASYTLLSFLLSNNDSRTDYIFSYPVNAPTGPHAALYQGDFNNHTQYSGDADLSLPILGPTDPVILMSSWESYFLQAEAVARGWGVGVDSTLYNTAIEESFNYYGLGDASSFYEVGGPYHYNGTTIEQKVEDIIVQKWVAMANLQNLEGWIEQSRTHYPRTSAVPASDIDHYVPGQFTIAVNNVTSGLFPKRLQYPDSEVTRNSNAPSLKPLTQKMWWDAKVD